MMLLNVTIFLQNYLFYFNLLSLSPMCNASFYSPFNLDSCCASSCNGKIILNEDYSQVLEIRGVHTCVPLSVEKQERLFWKMQNKQSAQQITYPLD